MGSYTQRFASLWVLIIAHYMKRATEMYSKVDNKILNMSKLLGCKLILLI